MKLGQHAKAAEIFMRAEDPASAAARLRAGGRPRQGLEPPRARWPSRPTSMAEAAAHFVKGRDFLRAAELFESVGMLAEAAGAYEAGESWAAAGSVYIRAGLKERAAASYERGGEFETAAKLYEEVGQRAQGHRALRQGRAHLQERRGRGQARASATGRSRCCSAWGRATRTTGRPPSCWPGSSSSRGRPALAVERVQKAVAGQPVSAANLDLYYWLGLAHEASGNGPRGPRHLQEDPVRGPAVPRRGPAGGARILVAGAPAAGPRRPPPAAARPWPRPRAAVRRRRPPPRGGRGRRPRAARASSPKEEIGRGPLGVVYRGEDAADGRNVALRVLPPDAPEGRRRPAPPSWPT